jgi:hypothetical protein
MSKRNRKPKRKGYLPKPKPWAWMTEEDRKERTVARNRIREMYRADGKSEEWIAKICPVEETEI